ncbi:ATP-binding protein [Thiorhodovibrio litoralis]|uniref:ATP-binding protein n=1 Tax=Thiorhodovibrio litoralis TaxID=2952932 RepID=UPI002B25F4DF|nr:ATP-binding protein [Thiorhodovibrio litoralis]WPL11594.1 putative AAA-ATPase [Thiorhodovibrio litoralis]
MSRKKLPIGVQNFAEIREGGYYYVDKSGFALRLVSEGKYYFLSRPRRFGKSLFLDTLAELLSGNRELFAGLEAEHKWNWDRRHPVIRLSFGGGVAREPADLKEKIWEQLRVNQKALGIRCSEPTAQGCFAELIREAKVQAGAPAVVLVDEYDKPILDNLGDKETARAMRDGLRDLYSVIKDSDAHLRFVFLTGVSKFSKVSLFSGLNNLKDITVDERYSALCGYTEEDLDQVFAPELEGLDRDQIRAWYNGYNWTGDAVYNPFDVLLLFDSRLFRPWWFETATPTFLIDVLKDRHTWLPALGDLRADSELLSAFDVGHISTEALLWQTGYLTIDSQEFVFGEYRYRLRYPNREVYQSLNNSLLRAWTADGQTTLANKTRLGDLLLANDFDGLKDLITAFFASIPHDWYRNNPISQYEGYYASVFYAYFASLGLDLTPEESSNAGRLDLAVKFNDQIYLIEFKVIEHSGEGAAMAQLKAKGYADKYRGQGQPIHLVGVEFSAEQRAVLGFEVETLN